MYMIYYIHTLLYTVHTFLLQLAAMQAGRYTGGQHSGRDSSNPYDMVAEELVSGALKDSLAAARERGTYVGLVCVCVCVCVRARVCVWVCGWACVYRCMSLCVHMCVELCVCPVYVCVTVCMRSHCPGTSWH